MMITSERKMSFPLLMMTIFLKSTDLVITMTESKTPETNIERGKTI